MAGRKGGADRPAESQRSDSARVRSASLVYLPAACRSVLLRASRGARRANRKRRRGTPEPAGRGQTRPQTHDARGHRAREALRKWVELWVRSLNGLESRRIYHAIAETSAMPAAP